MKKIIALVLVLLIPCIAVAEQDVFQIEGEWYVVPMNTYKMCHKAELKEDGSFYVSRPDGEYTVFHEKGKIDYIHSEESTDYFTKETRWETKKDTTTMEYCRLSEKVVLYYDIKDNDFFGYYILYGDDGWLAYSLYNTSMVFFLNGKATPYNGNGSADYLVSGDSMFLAQDGQYIRGSIEQQGDNAIVFYIDDNSKIFAYKDTDVDHGTPFCLFISTSIMK